MIDLHVHTWRCRHATGEPADYVRAAAERGVSTLAFTEHVPLAPVLQEAVDGAECYAMPAEELEEYVSDVRAAMSIGHELGVEVLLGIEVDAVEAALEHARAMLAQHPFDVVLGSVHFIGTWAFDDPDRQDRAGEWTADEMWERYFEDLERAVRARVADVVAHADLVKKFRVRPPADVARLYRRAARALADAGAAVEVNTAGLRKPCAELYPAQAFLTECCKAGVPATIGSDAHCPSEVGHGAQEARHALLEAGYRSVVVFRRRVAEEVAIDAL